MTAPTHEEVIDAVCDWHRSDGHEEVIDYLGWSWSEWQRFVADHRAIPDRPLKNRRGPNKVS